MSEALGLRSTLVKGVSANDGRAYALRRIDGKQVGHLEEMWLTVAP